MNRSWLVMDLGGTWLRLGLMTEQDYPTAIQQWPTPHSAQQLLELIRLYQHQFCPPMIHGYGLAVAGIIKSGVVISNNLPWLSALGDLGRWLCQQLACSKVSVRNDMVAAAIAEQHQGALSQCTTAWFDTISTGWGSILWVSGQIIPCEAGQMASHIHGKSLETCYSGQAMQQMIAQAGYSSWATWHEALAQHEIAAEASLTYWLDGVMASWLDRLRLLPQAEKLVYTGTTANKLLSHSSAQTRLQQLQAETQVVIQPAIWPQAALYGAGLSLYP